MSAPLNFQTLYELDINPSGSANYVRLGDGLTTATPGNNETVDQKSYLDDDGGQSSEVTGFQYILAFSGDRIPGDDAQDFIFERIFALGESRHTNFRATGADGTVISGDVTIANITPPGGDANAVQACGFELHFNGKPTLTAPVAATALSAVVAAGSAIGTTKFTATAGAGNKLAYRLTSSALSANNRQYISIFTEYTSAANIPAASGQYLNMYELDAYNHVVKFLSVVLESADIRA